MPSQIDPTEEVKPKNLTNMREDYNDYDDAQYEDEYDQYEEQQVDNKAVRGYRIVIIILAVILVALSVVYFNMHRQQAVEYALWRRTAQRFRATSIV